MKKGPIVDPIKFEVFKGKGRSTQFYYRVIADNAAKGEIVLQSEAYTRLSNAHRAVGALWSAMHVALRKANQPTMAIPYTDDTLFPRRPYRSGRYLPAH